MIGPCWATIWSRSRKSHSTRAKWRHRRSADAREPSFLAVVAFFRHPSGLQWRVASKPAPPDAQYCHAPGSGDTEAARSALRLGLVDSRVELQ